MKTFIPNAITLLNLILGCLAIIALLQTHFNLACYLLAGAALADFADGLVARLLGVSSDLGKELDSLADAVSFGVVPGMIFYILLVLGDAPTANQALLWSDIQWYAAPAFLLTAFSIYRLAKFNLDSAQSDHFIGLATPANTVFAVGLLIIYYQNSWELQSFVGQRWFLYLCVFLFSFLLNANISMFSFKLKSLKWQENKRQFIFGIISITMLIFFKAAALAPIIVVYILQNVFIYLGDLRR